MRCIFEQKILKNVPHCNITDNRTLLVSLLWGDGRHFAFTHTTDRPKFNCSCAAPRSVRGCWTVTTWETQRDQLWSVAHPPYFSIGIPCWGRVAESIAFTPKTLQQFCCTEHPHRKKTAAQNWMLCSFPPTFFHRNRREKKKSSTTAPFFLTFSGAPCPSISENSWGCSIVMMQDPTPYPSLASSCSQRHSLGLTLDCSWAVSSLWAYQKNSSPRNFCCLTSSCFLTNSLENLFLSD